MVKSKKKHLGIIITVLILLLVITFLIPITYNTTVEKKDILVIEDFCLKENEFEIINSYCKKSNKTSINPFEIYNELFVVEISVNNASSIVGYPNTESRDFYKCSTEPEPLKDNGFTNYYILKTIPEFTTEKWVNAIYDKSLNWYISTPPKDEDFGKKSAKFFVAYNESNPTIAYLILDQS